ncbi:MAG: T9SS type A sorting domain-containing protein [Flavobacteriales bacterium]|nr:T9SS type A sorting domain-containing protein [Flavobacteriales bacterium]
MTICTTISVGGTNTDCDPNFTIEVTSAPTNAGFMLIATAQPPADGFIWTFSNGLVLTGPSIEVSLLSDLGLEVCVSAWYWSGSDTCWASVCGAIGEWGFVAGLPGSPDAPVMSVYPNPATDMVVVEGGPITGSTVLELLASDGRLVHATTVTQWPYRMPVGSLAPGAYLLRVGDGSSAFSSRLMVVR